MSMMRSTGGRSLRGELDRFFDDFFGGQIARRGDGAVGVWTPAVNVREDQNNYYVEAEVPGMSKDDIQIEVENNVLSLRGERRFEKKEEKENWHFVERSYGSFYRSFALPKNVNADAIQAEYKDGVLHLTLPKHEEVKPKKVSIS